VIARERLDAALVRTGAYPTIRAASAAVMAGRVTVDGRPAAKPGQPVRAGAQLAVRAPAPFVSRAGAKLAGALDRFGLRPDGLICLDAGAATGGFTDCLLQRGAARVYAVDVGYGQLAWSLRTDPRVIVRERTNARHLGPADIPEPVDLAVADLSFISLTKVLPALAGRLRPAGPCDSIVPLIKPQFEAAPRQVGPGGVVVDPRVHEDVLQRVCLACAAAGWAPAALVPSTVRGVDGNREFLALLRRTPGPDVAQLVAAAVAEAWGRA